MASLDPETILSMHAKVGGDPWFVALVDRFYATVEDDPTLLRPPPGARHHLFQGPRPLPRNPDPALPRSRHHHRLPHSPIFASSSAMPRSPSGRSERYAWLEVIDGAARSGGLSDEDVTTLLGDAPDMAATAMINQPG